MTAEKEALETASQCVAADASGPVIVTELPMPGLPDFWSIRSILGRAPRVFEASSFGYLVNMKVQNVLALAQQRAARS
jgi:hypothetical protein